MPSSPYTFNVRDEDTNEVKEGLGVRIGDRYVLTAGHVFFEWNRDDSHTPLLTDIRVAIQGSQPVSFEDLRGYRAQYRLRAEINVNAPGNEPDNEVIESNSSLIQRDMVAFKLNSGGQGTIGDDHNGLVTFIEDDDLANITGVLGAGARISRSGPMSSSSGSDHVMSSNGNGTFIYTKRAYDGDSGGAYLLRYGGEQFVVGIQSAITPNQIQGHIRGVGTYITYAEWTTLNNLMEQDVEPGNVTTNEPTNLVVGSSTNNVIAGSYRPDKILGRGGDDEIDDGDGPTDTVYANDTLIGGEGNDTFKTGAGDDTIWGSNLDDRAVNEGSFTDTVDYSASTVGITISFHGDEAGSTVTVGDGRGGTDTLHSIERIVATGHTDVLNLSGSIQPGYNILIDLAGGSDSIANASAASGRIVVLIDGEGNGTARSPDSNGTIQLRNANTQIIGSSYDDEITDLSEHDGVKKIDGGMGNDVIVADGSDALVRGGEGDDEITGGEGNDRLYGQFGTDIVHGGEGSDFLTNQYFDNLPFNQVIVDDDELHGDEGHDYLMLARGSADGTLIGGAGNDVLDAREGSGGSVRFGHGDGHDMIMSDREIGVDFQEELDGINEIDMTGVQKSDITFIWNPTYLIEHILPSGNPQDTPGELIRQGDLAIRIDSTGDTLLIRAVVGSTTYWGDPSEASEPPFDHIFDRVRFDFLENIEFADGFIEREDFLGSSPLVSIQIGSVDAYATALSDFHGEIDPDPADNEGDEGDNDIGGSGGDDSIDGGDGNDNFQGSGGTDTIDGGAGVDRLTLFGALGDYSITRDEATGAITLTDYTGLEGSVTIVNVERVYFASDNEEYAAADLVGFWGTENNDTLEGNEGSNELHGLEGDDLLRGHGGDDELDGGEGDDVMEGGDGNDTYLVDAVGDSVVEAADAGDDEVKTDLASYTLGANVERLRGTSATGQALTGNGLDNVLMGNAAADTLDGGGGIDVSSWAWSETGFTADLQTSTFTGDAALDTLVSIEGLGGGAGDDTLSGTSGANILDGSVGADTLTGRGGDDIYYVDDENDVVVEASNEGNDEVRVSLGYFTFDTANVEVLRFVGDGSHQGVGDSRDNIMYAAASGGQLEGRGGADQLHGSDGNDDILGGDGADIVDGGGGKDYLEGGAGDDIYHVGEEDDTVVELADEGEDTVLTTFNSHALGEHVENLFYVGADDFEGIGNAGDNEIGGGDGNDELSGGEGDDIIHSSLGADRVDGGDGTDLLRLEGARNAFVATVDEDGVFVLLEQGGLGRMILLSNVEAVYFADDDATYSIEDLFDTGGGTEGDDLLEGDENDNQLFGLGGNDTILGHGGNDLLDGGTGTDAMTGHAGDDTYFVDEAGDTVTEAANEGADMVASTISYTLGANLEMLVLSGAAAIDGTGNALANLIVGNDAANQLSGLDGDDILDGGLGGDAMTGGSGGDIYYVDDAGDTVTETSGLGTDEVRTTLASYTLGSNVERLTGLAATGQALTGNGLANLLMGGAGADTFSGGLGSDTVSWAWSTAGVSVDLTGGATGGDAAGDSFVSIENLTGGAGADTLSGTSAANILDGGAGADTLTGRGGNDIYYVDNAGDVVVETSGQGIDEVRTTLAALTLAANIEALRYAGAGGFAGTGNELSNTVHGGGQADTLSGADGYDSLYGLGGDDLLLGGADGDVLDGGVGADTMEGGTGSDNYIVDNSGDVVVELSGEGVDQVYTTLAAYTLGDHVENLTAQSGGGQALTGNALANIILGLGGADTLSGGDGDDELRGNFGDDSIDGGGGADLIVGNSGVDTLTGGAGADTFRFYPYDSVLGGADTITDFVAGVDKIDLSNIDAGFWTAGMQDFSFIGTDAFSAVEGELRYSFNGTMTWVMADWNGDAAADLAIALAGNVVLQASDFVL